jgi:hypothetical protein
LRPATEFSSVPDAGPRALGFAADGLLQPIIRYDFFGPVTFLVDFFEPGIHDLQKRNVQIEDVPNTSGKDPLRTWIRGLKARQGPPFDCLPVLPK